MDLFIGTSGFSYKEWKGSFYPEDLPAAKMLPFYAERFRSVEINNTFYRMPQEKTLSGWIAQVPPHFRFVLKAPQRITHQGRLKDVADPLAYFFRTALVLGAQLGPTLVQLPPFLKKDVPRLRDFLALVPKECRVAIEFRHDSWFDDEVYAALSDSGAALCIAEGDALATPVRATASFGYFRLRREDYVDSDLTLWADRIRAQAFSECYVFFKHEDKGRGPALAAQLIDLLA